MISRIPRAESFLANNFFASSTLLILLYLSLNIGLRWAGIAENVLYGDDWLLFVDHSDTIISYGICRFPPQDNRWISIYTFCLSNLYLQDFVFSPWPKILACAFWATVGYGLFYIFRKWGVNFLLASLMPVLLLSHPIINEVILWNTVTYTGFLYSGVILSYCALSFSASSRDRLIGVLLLMGAAITYEYAIVLFLLLALSEPFIQFISGRRYSIKKTLTLVSVFVGASVFYLVQAKLTSYFFPDPFGFRGIEYKSETLFVFSNLLAKFRSLLNLTANVYMTPLSYYFPVESLWSWWLKFPLVVAVLTFVGTYLKTLSLKTSSLIAVFSVSIVLIPLAPLLISSQSPESWRVSIPSLFAVLISLVPLCVVAKTFLNGLLKFLGTLVLISLAVTMAIASYSESDLRKLENSLEAHLIEEIENYWSKNAVVKSKVRVGRVDDNYYAPVQGLHPAMNLSLAFNRRGLQQDLNYEIAWRGKLLKNGFKIVEIESDQSSFSRRHSIGCQQASQCLHDETEYFLNKCDSSPDHIQTDTGLRLVHDPIRFVSVICL